MKTKIKQDKIALYTIMKNEIKNIDGFLQSIYDNGDCVDYVCVLDTGSTDDSIEYLKKRAKEIGFSDNQIIVDTKTYDTFRFDESRNDSLKLVPKDANWCISIDLDERFVHGYLRNFKQAFKEKDAGFVQYMYAWSVDQQTNKPIREFMYCKCHRNDPDIKWIFPVHERLNIDEKLAQRYKIVTINGGSLVYHYPDLSKSRKSYLNLLLLRHKEDPTNSNTMYYIAREYGFIKDWVEALHWYNKLWFAYYTDNAIKNQDINAIKHVYWNMGEIYRNINAVSDAKHIYEKGLNECPCQMIYMSAAEFFNLINEPEKALSCVTKCIDNRYNVLEDQDFRLETVYYRPWFVYYMKAFSYFRLNKFNLANRFFDEAFADIKTTNDEDYAYVHRLYDIYQQFVDKLFEMHAVNENVVPDDFLKNVPKRFIKKN